MYYVVGKINVDSRIADSIHLNLTKSELFYWTKANFVHKSIADTF